MQKKPIGFFLFPEKNNQGTKVLLIIKQENLKTDSEQEPNTRFERITQSHQRGRNRIDSKQGTNTPVSKNQTEHP